MKGELTILGAGISAKGAAELAVKQGYSVFVSEKAGMDEKETAKWRSLGVDIETGGHTEERILNSGLIIKSPGIPDTIPLLVKARECGISVIDELEFAWQYIEEPSALITGTNGKTTTTRLTAHILQSAGIHAAATGNVGRSLAGAVAVQPAEMYVVEASSFQLDGMKEARADCGVLLNITTDHLDRYGSMEKYIESKHQIEYLIKDSGVLIYNADDEKCRPVRKDVRHCALSLNADVSCEGILKDGQLCFRENDEWHRIHTATISLRGRHNYLNALAASWISRYLGVGWNDIEKGLNTYENIAHRMQLIGEIDGVSWYNDSKATNLEAVKYAIESFGEPVIWIAGGVDKGNDYSEVLSLVEKHVKGLICLGKDNAKLKEAFAGVTEIIGEAEDVDRVVALAAGAAEEGDVVLLSPACASFDLFSNYEDRGEKFIGAVNRWAKKTQKMNK